MAVSKFLRLITHNDYYVVSIFKENVKICWNYNYNIPKDIARLKIEGAYIIPSTKNIVIYV